MLVLSCYAGKVYIRNKDGSEELYDHATDPAESRDLSKSSEGAGAARALSPRDESDR